MITAEAGMMVSVSGRREETNGLLGDELLRNDFFIFNRTWSQVLVYI
jgi:hypothetical protein